LIKDISEKVFLRSTGNVSGTRKKSAIKQIKPKQNNAKKIERQPNNIRR
jgi:hypothetical protein